MSNPVDRDMARMMRDMRRKLAKEAPRPRPDTEVDDLLTPEADSRLGPSEPATA